MTTYGKILKYWLPPSLHCWQSESPVDHSRYERSLPGVDPPQPDRSLQRRPETDVGADRGPTPDLLQAGVEMAPAAPVSLHAVVPVPVQLELVGGEGCEGAVRQAGGPSHLHLATPKGPAGVAGEPAGWVRGVNTCQDDPGLGGTRQVWLGVWPGNTTIRIRRGEDHDFESIVY